MGHTLTIVIAIGISPLKISVKKLTKNPKDVNLTLEIGEGNEKKRPSRNEGKTHVDIPSSLG